MQPRKLQCCIWRLNQIYSPIFVTLYVLCFQRQFFLTFILGASYSAKHKLQLDKLTMETHNFTASLFYFRASEGGNIGLYAHTPCNFLNLTEIFLHWKDY